MHEQQTQKADEAIKKIIKDPTIGEQKKGYLNDIYVYKFNIDHQLMLLGYKWDPKTRILMALGVHENFIVICKKK